MTYLIPTGDTVVKVDTAEDLIAALTPMFGKPGLSTKRAIDDEEVTTALARLADAKSRVRVYSSWGFVANSYKYRSDIQFVEANLDENGDWVWTTGWGRAQRSYGKAETVVVK